MKVVVMGIVLTCLIVVVLSDSISLENTPGHLRPLGEGRPIHQVQKVEGFPNTRWFFENFVKLSKPLLMKNAAKLSPAFTRWTDEYFLSQNEPQNHTVLVELNKKEICDSGTNFKRIPFKRFVQTYNESGQYMVSAVPPFIAPDVMLPTPLQCPQMVRDILVEHMMWFSSGGTKSILHDDPIDNINCLFRGQKEALLVPYEHASKVDIGDSFCGLDVDSVDYTKYPGFAEVEFYKASMVAGDCLYIPYKVFHQVRSYDSNLAVNLWWDYFLGLQVDLDQCPDQVDPDMTLDKAKFMGFRDKKQTVLYVKNHFIEYSEKGSLDVKDVERLLLRDILDDLKELDMGKSYLSYVQAIFSILDGNSDGTLEHNEVISAEHEQWQAVMEKLMAFDRMMGALQEGEETQSPTPNNKLSDEL